MALKKPSEYFKKNIATVNDSVQDLVKNPELNTFSDAFESFKNNLSKIETLSEFSDTLDNYRINIERVNYLSNKVEGIQTEIQSLLKKEDLDRAMMSQLLVVEQSIRDVQNKVKGINENKLTEIRLDVSGLTKSVNEFLEVEVPKYKKLVVESELRTNNRYNELEENVNQTLEGIGEFVDDKYQQLTETLQGINEQSLAGILEDFKLLDENFAKLKEEEIPKYKGFIVETERKTESKLEEFNQVLEETTDNLLAKISIVEGNKADLIRVVNDKIQEIVNLRDLVISSLEKGEEAKKNLNKKVTELEVEIVRNESHIKVQNKNLEQIQEDVKTAIQRLNLEEIEEKNYELSKKVKYLEEIFEKFNEREILTENILTEPPSTDNKDPLTPLDQKFVTLDQLQDHYRLFINRVQQQLATLGGGGETRLKYLDDIVGIATNSSAYDGKYLRYNHSLGKFEFVDVDITNDSWGDGSTGPYTNDNVGIGTTDPTSKLTVIGDALISGVVTAGIITATTFYGKNIEKITQINSNYSVQSTDSVIIASGTITITMPSSSTVFGDKYYIKNVGVGTVTIKPSGADLIDDYDEMILNEKNSSLTLISYGNNWYIF